MTAFELVSAAEVLFGPSWRKSFPAAIGVHSASVRRWIANNDVPFWVELAIDGLHYRRGF
jgi:hypothetical protein